VKLDDAIDLQRQMAIIAKKTCLDKANRGQFKGEKYDKANYFGRQENMEILYYSYLNLKELTNPVQKGFKK